jgi:peptidoglycan/LPS O-acetylase OafA/YrhL
VVVEGVPEAKSDDHLEVEARVTRRWPPWLYLQWFGLDALYDLGREWSAPAHVSRDMQVRTRTRTEIAGRRQQRRPAVAARAATTLPYRAGIDGLRAIAVTAILLADSGTDVLAGGYLAIEVLFVLSGFMLTSLLLAEHGARGRVHLVRFWTTRARRTLPALLTIVGGVSIAVLAVRPAMLPGLGPDVRAALVGMSNWHVIAVSQGTAPAESALWHLWPLAVGAQFVAWWPLAFSVLRSRLGLRRLRLVVLMLAVASALGMAAVSVSGDLPRALYGTDTRASGLLLGALVALAFRPSAWEDRATGARARRLRLFGLAVLAALFAVIVVATPRALWVPRGGVLVVAVLSALAVAVVLRSAELDRMLGVAPLRWLGRRANGIYLWHWPVLVVIGVRTVAGDPLVFALYLVVTVVLAAVTQRLIVTPLSRPRRRSGPGPAGRSGLATGATAVACGVATVVALLNA